MDWSLEGRAFWREIFLAVAMSIVAGVVFGALMQLISGRDPQKKIGRRLDRIFASDPRIVPPAPSDATHRLACAVVLERGRFLPGILYVRPTGLDFQSNYLRHSWWRRDLPQAGPVVEIAPYRTITLQPAELEQSWLQRRLTRRPPPVILVTWAAGALVLRTAATDRSLTRLQQCVDERRTDTTSSAPAV